MEYTGRTFGIICESFFAKNIGRIVFVFSGERCFYV